jgi:hypothetical protein
LYPHPILFGFEVQVALPLQKLSVEAESFRRQFEHKRREDMKRQIVTFLMVLALATGTALWAQSTGTTQSPPPSQQVDQSGQPETGTGPDVDVDVGRNAEDGLVDVEVKRNADSDTAAQGNDPNPRVDLDNDNDQDTTGTYGSTATGVDNDNDNLPETAGNGPLFALLGLMSLAGAFLLRTIR